MDKRLMPLHTLLGIAIFLTLTGTAWAVNCGDTAGAGGTNVLCNCGDTVVTNTTLISPAVDLVNGDPVVSTDEVTDPPCPGDGLILNPGDNNSARINLSLGDNPIRGSGSMGSVGIKIIGVNIKVTVRNGRVQGFETGVATTGTIRNSIINKITAANNLGDGVNVAGNSNEFNTPEGVENGGTGIRVAGNGNTMLFGRASQNGGNGMEVIGDENVLRTSTVNRNVGVGMQVEGNKNLVDHGLVENNDSDGMVIMGDGDGNPATLEVWKNKVTRNGGNGISVDGDNHVIDGNQGSTNDGDGITVFGTGNRLKANKATGNGGNGIDVTGGGNTNAGGNVGKKNGGPVQCAIDGAPC